MKSEWQSARRLLVVRLDNMGDVLLTGPAVRSLAMALPYAAITALCGPAGFEAGGLLPDVADVLVHEAPWVDPWRQVPFDAARELTLVEHLRSSDFDAAVIFTSYRQSSLPAAYLCYLAGIPLRAGISFEASGSMLTTRVIPAAEPKHEVERNLDLVQAIGIPAEKRALAVEIPGDARATAERWIDENVPVTASGPLVVLHPGCSMPARTYPAHRFAEVVRLLVRELDAQVIVTGLDSERVLVDDIFEELTGIERCSVHPRVGNDPLGVLGALLEISNLVITNNTGPMHLAAAVGTPSVVLFALTNPPGEWCPWQVPHRLLYQDVPCRNCYSRVCPHEHHPCLNGVTPAAVVAGARELLTSAAVV